jgi:hypothetical protein
MEFRHGCLCSCPTHSLRHVFWTIPPRNPSPSLASQWIFLWSTPECLQSRPTCRFRHSSLARHEGTCLQCLL